MKTLSKVLNKEFDFSVKHLGLEYDENFWLKDSYIITINKQRFEYSQGIGHREPLNKYRENDFKTWINFNSVKEHDAYDYLITQLNSCSKPKSINIDDVLYSLILDAQFGSDSFSDFCDNLGYDSDSIKHLNIYFECEKTAKKIQSIGINIYESSELFNDY